MTITELAAIAAEIQFMDRKFLIMEKGDGFLVQLSYMDADVERPGSPPMLQKSRKWYISRYMTESEVVETFWAMCCRSMMHVASEHFSYRNRRIYSQHFSARARIEMIDRYDLDKRLNSTSEPPR